MCQVFIIISTNSTKIGLSYDKEIINFGYKIDI